MVKIAYVELGKPFIIEFLSKWLFMRWVFSLCFFFFKFKMGVWLLQQLWCDAHGLVSRQAGGKKKTNKSFMIQFPSKWIFNMWAFYSVVFFPNLFFCFFSTLIFLFLIGYISIYSFKFEWLNFHWFSFKKSSIKFFIIQFLSKWMSMRWVFYCVLFYFSNIA